MYYSLGSPAGGKLGIFDHRVSSGYLSPIILGPQVLLPKKMVNVILECINIYVMDETLGDMCFSVWYCRGIAWKCHAQYRAPHLRNTSISKWGAEDRNENENKRLRSREKGRRGWVCTFWKRRLWEQDKKGHSTTPKARGMSVSFCVLGGHYTRHRSKSQQGRRRRFFARRLNRLQRGSLSMVVFKNSLDKRNWG